MPEVGVEIWEEPARGSYFHPLLSALSSEEREAAFRNGRWLPPPIHHLVGLTYVESSAAGSTFTMPVTGWLMPPQGVVQGSTLFLLADGPLGSAIQFHTPPATPSTTSEISLSFIAPVTKVGQVLTARAHTVHVGRSLALSETVILDGSGRAVARGGCRMVLLPQIELPDGALAAARALPALAPTEYDTPDPYLRPVRGEVLSQEVFDRLDGLSLVRGCISGDLPAPPIAHLTGLRPIEAAEGSSTWEMPATEWHCSPVKGRLYGGATAFLAGSAVEGTIETTVAAGTAFATVDLKVYFLRPVTPDGRPLTARGTIVHRGRQVVVASSEVLDADGKRVAVAVGSAMILPGRPAMVAGAVGSGAADGEA
jgi:uncharacterized protein (TIGR00369 family)